jgi:3-oxoacyl-[acyl-carrier protein] reductase
MSRAALVLGGARGIGAAIALRLARDGCDVALTYVGRADSAETVAAEIRRAGRKALPMRVDSAARWRR